MEFCGKSYSAAQSLRTQGLYEAQASITASMEGTPDLRSVFRAGVEIGVKLGLSVAEDSAKDESVAMVGVG